MRHITLSEYLRPWSQAGISHFLADPDALFLDMAEKGTGKIVCDGSVASTVKSSEPFNGYSSRAEEKTGIETISPLGPVSSPLSSITSCNTSENAVAAFTASPAPSIDASLVPDEWQKLLARTPAAPVLWSYDELGLDLVGKGSPERSACLRTIIGRLSLPKGSSAFWPYSLPDAGGSLRINLNAYHFGLSRLHPSVIVLLGMDAVKAVSPILTLHIPFMQQVHEGRLHILLPDFTQLQANVSLLDSACTYLRSALSTLSALRS